MAINEANGRAKKTLAWIVQSFYELLGKRQYDDIHVSEIVGNAGAGRSTFYDHFKSKDQLLERSLRGVLAVLADAATVEGEIDAVGHTLSHFWDVRHRIRGLAFGTTELIVSKQLADLIELRLEALCRERGIQLAIPCRLAAAQLAGSQLGLIRAWLGDESFSASDLIARALQQSSKSILDALLSDSIRIPHVSLQQSRLGGENSAEIEGSGECLIDIACRPLRTMQPKQVC